MKILITGANGFIGSYCMKFFSDIGFEVTGLVRQDPKINRYKYIIHDIRESIHFSENFDVIIHAASEIDKTQKKLETYVNGNIIGTKKLLEFACQHAGAFINLSTVRSFGVIESDVLSEDTPIKNPGYYGITKYVAERMVLEADIPSISLILPGVVGQYGHTPWIMRMANEMLRQNPIECYQPEALFNNIIHVETLAECILKIIEQKIYLNTRIILGSKNPITKYNVLIKLKKYLSSKSQINIVKNDSLSFLLNIEKAEKEGLVLGNVKSELKKLAYELLENSKINY